MELFWGDYDTPLDHYSKLLGYTWLGVLYPRSEGFAALAAFRWDAYTSDVHARFERTRVLSVSFSDGERWVTFDVDHDLGWLVDQIPSIMVYREVGPPSNLPTPYSIGFLFFVREGSTMLEANEDVHALLASIEADHERLQADGLAA